MLSFRQQEHNATSGTTESELDETLQYSTYLKEPTGTLERNWKHQTTEIQ